MKKLTEKIKELQLNEASSEQYDQCAKILLEKGIKIIVLYGAGKLHLKVGEHQIQIDSMHLI